MTTRTETEDVFLGGRLRLWQPARGYRAGVDPLLLAASVAVEPGQSVLDLGCGAGAAALALGARVPDLQLCGIERDSLYADLARRNGMHNAQDFTVFEADLSDPPAALRAMSFHIVMANPPYYDRTRGNAAPDARREAALGEDTPLDQWISLAAKRLRPRGYFYAVIKADRLGDVLASLSGRLGSVQILPLAPRAGRAAELVLIRARKDGRAPLKLLSPLILHEGDAHPGDRDHYTPPINAVLRNAAALDIWA